MRLNLEKFKYWMVVISESGEEGLRSGSVFKGNIRVHYKGSWKESRALGLSLMLGSDMEQVRSLAETVDNELVIDIQKIVRSDVPLAFASNAKGYRRIPPEEFDKIEKGDLVTAMVSLNVDEDGKTWLNAMNIELAKKGDLESFRYGSAPSESKSRPSDFASGPTYLEKEANKGLRALSNDEEELSDMYWNIN